MLRRPATLLTAGLVFVLLSLGQATAFPGANGRIAFASDRDGDFDIYTLPAGGGSATQVVNAAGSDTQPAFSPDGTQIAYTHDGDIYVVAATTVGGSGTSRTSGATADDEPHWSNDGTMIIFVRDNDIYVMTSAGGSITPLVATAATERSPVWSSDGDKIAYESDATGNFEIYTANTDGGSPANVSQSAGSDTDPAWSPDGDKLAFIRDGDLWTMNEDGGGQTRLTTAGNVDSHPTWSPNGAQIAFTVTGTNDDIFVIPAGGGSATQFTTEASQDRQPDWGTMLALTSKPSINEGGAAVVAPLEDGTTLTAVPAAPVNNNPGAAVTNTYQWMRCDAAGANCVDIGGATSESYTVQSADIGFRLRVRQIATSSDGSASAISDATPTVVAAAPDNVAPPSISPIGAITIGQTLTADEGTWLGSQPMTFAYQWYRCTGTDLASCTVAIAGETATTYLLRSEDLDKYIRVLVTGSNSLGTASEYSQPTDQVATAAPVNVVLPTITGTMKVGTIVSATAGTWAGTPAPTFTYQWQRCNADGTGCANIPGATSASYTIVAADSGKKLQVVVKATNISGIGTVSVLATDAVVANPPVNSTRPSVTGLARVGSVLSATTGTWTGTLPITYTYQWQRCDADGENCVNITGATASTYIPTAVDVAKTVVVSVTATNTGGFASVASLETTAVTSSTSTGTGTSTRPANTSVPRITGTAAKNSLLVATPGSWSGTTPMTFSYQWQRCTTTTTCTAILRATLSTYRALPEDVGKRLRVVVTAGNGAGSATASSAVTDLVKATGPVSTAGITRRGTAKNDRLVGTPRNDTLLGLAGNDSMFGRAGQDTLRGDAGNDTLLGEAGVDALYGDAGKDTITGGAGRDRFFGGTGNDTIGALDGEIDDIDCGAGRDVVRADKLDRLRNCERVTRATFKKAVKKKAATTKKKAAAKKKTAPKKAKAVARGSSSSSNSTLVDAVNAAIAWAGKK